MVEEGQEGQEGQVGQVDQEVQVGQVDQEVRAGQEGQEGLGVVPEAEEVAQEEGEAVPAEAKDQPRPRSSTARPPSEAPGGRNRQTALFAPDLRGFRSCDVLRARPFPV